MLSMFRDDSTRKQNQNRKPSYPTPKGCGFYGLFDKGLLFLGGGLFSYQIPVLCPIRGQTIPEC